MYAQMGVEIIGQQTSLADVVSLFLDLFMCVYACAVCFMFGRCCSFERPSTT